LVAATLSRDERVGMAGTSTSVAVARDVKVEAGTSR
jgi:hypothetical protein